MNRRRFLATTAMAAAAQTADQKRPNILWISCEDCSPHFGCYGDKQAITPNVDRLATQGVRFTRAHSVAGVCAPSRSGIITAVYPSSLGSQYMRSNVVLPAHIHCFPAYLRDAGYYCTNNSKTDYNFPVPKDAWDDSSASAHWKNRKPGQPFFAVFNILTTHESQCRKRGADYDKMVTRLKAEQRQDPAKLTLPPYYPDKPESRRDWAQLYELITAMDLEVGDRLKELEDAGLLENTIVFFWGDHGDGVPRAKRWLYEASTHVPLVVRIPERYRTARQGQPGTVDGQLVSLLDLGPTVLNLASVPVPKHMDGRPFLGTNLPPERDYVYGARDRMDERYDSVRMVRDRRYRYLRNYMPHLPYAQTLAYMEEGNIMKELRLAQKQDRVPPAARLFMGESKPLEELYDVDADPHELKNLAASPAHENVIKRMRAAHEKWALDTRDVGLIPEPEVDARGRAAGTRYQILRTPSSEKYIRELRALVDAVNRGEQSSIVRNAVNHSDSAMRYWGIVGLSLSSEAANGARELIAKATADPSPSVRIAALRAAALHLGDGTAIPKLAKELKDSNPYVRLNAAQALEAQGPRAESVLREISAAVSDENEYVKRVAEHVMAVFSKE